MKKVIKGITYNTENAIKHFVINKETETEWIHKEFYHKKKRYGQKEMFFVYIDKWNGCGPDSVRISEDIKPLTYKEALELFEERYGDKCNNNNTYNYIKELLDEENVAVCKVDEFKFN